MHTQKVVSLHPILAFIFGLNQETMANSLYSTPASDVDTVETDESVQLAFGDVEYIDNYCRRVINGTASIRKLIYALPSLIKTMRKRSLSERATVKDSLKQVLFHADISDTERERIYNSVCEICRM